jgi:hypothetical protein
VQAQHASFQGRSPQRIKWLAWSTKLLQKMGDDVDAVVRLLYYYIPCIKIVYSQNNSENGIPPVHHRPTLSVPLDNPASRRDTKSIQNGVGGGCCDSVVNKRVRLKINHQVSVRMLIQTWLYE